MSDPDIIPGYTLPDADGPEGNAFNLLGDFRRQALRAGWTAEQVGEVTATATSGDYGHLRETLGRYQDGDVLDAMLDRARRWQS